MIALIQRVSRAEVAVAGSIVGRIDAGLLALIGVERDDDEQSAAKLLARVLAYRVFNGVEGRMNRSLTDTAGGLRPGFSSAAKPARAQGLFEHLVDLARHRHAAVESGRFGATMQVSLVNDGPVTFWLRVAPREAGRT